MKKSLLPLLLAIALLPAAPAVAEPVGVYIAPRLSAAQVRFNFKYVNDNWYNSGSREKWTYGGALAVGYDFYSQLKFPVRLELEYGGLGDVEGSKSKSEGNLQWKGKATLGVRTLFVNAYFDWHNASAFTPYASFGLGTSFLDAKSKDADTWNGTTTYHYDYGKKTTANTAWNIGLGGALRLSDTVALDLGYRYADLGEARTKTDPSLWGRGEYYKAKKVETHQILLGARFTF